MPGGRLPRRCCRPLTGARIETSTRCARTGFHWSPPHRGADRNRRGEAENALRALSPPHRGADRNRNAWGPFAKALLSPPHRGADRNIDALRPYRFPLVAPSQGRGSKLERAGSEADDAGSPPHRGADRNRRGEAENALRALSPPHRGADRNTCTVAPSALSAGRPLTGARIETGLLSLGIWQMSRSRPLTGARIETPRVARASANRHVWPPHRGAFKTKKGRSG